MYLTGEEKEREGVDQQWDFPPLFTGKSNHVDKLNLRGQMLQPWLLCSDVFCCLRWVIVSYINQCKGCILILGPSSGHVTGTRPVALLSYMTKCEWQVTVMSPKGANLFGYFLFSNLVTLCQRWLGIQCCWCGCPDLFGIKLVLYIHIYHQWFHTEEYNEIFVANL